MTRHRAIRSSANAGLWLVACAATLALGAPALAAGTVSVREVRKTILVKGDAADNQIGVALSSRDVVVTGSGGTAVANPTVPLDGVTRIVIDMRQGGNDSVVVTPAPGLPLVNLPDLDLVVTMGVGGDYVELNAVGFLNATVHLGGGDDTSRVNGIKIGDVAAFDGGQGIDDARHDSVYNVRFTLRGFESLWD